MTVTKKIGVAAQYEHPILDRVYAINKDYVEDSDWETAPHNRQEFLDWWWTQFAENCQRCVLGTSRTLTVKPDGFVGDGQQPLIMIVGEGPGVNEDACGLPMISPLTLRASRCGMCKNVQGCYSHKMLSRPDSRHPRNKDIVCKPNVQKTLQLREKFYIQSAGSVLDGILIKLWKFNYPRHSWVELHNRLHPDQAWTHGSPWFVSNCVLCRSFDRLTKKDTPPGTAAKNICRRWFVWQWAAVQPVITVCLGVPALEAVTQGRERTSVRAGEIFHTAKFGPILYQPHPASIMREEHEGMQGLGFARLADTLRRALEYAGYPTD